MKCSYAQELMMKYIDNEITAEEKNMLEEHTKTCPQCQSEFEFYANADFSGFHMEAPISEDVIMSRIEILSPQHKENIAICWAVGVLTGVIGLLLLLMTDKYLVLHTMAQTGVFIPLIGYVDSLSQFLRQIPNVVLSSVNRDALQLIGAMVVAAFAAIQVWNPVNKKYQ